MTDQTGGERISRWPLWYGSPIPLPQRQGMVFLLVGFTFLFSGYDLNVYGLAIPQIQLSLHIPEDQTGLTVSYFRLATLIALFIAPLADIFGRRRLILFTIVGEALFTLASAFAQTYPEYVWLQICVRICGYCEELLCFVIVAEEIDERARGWSMGALGAMNALGVGVASLMFALVQILPFGWRSLYVIGSGALIVLAWYRRWLPETRRFELRREELKRLGTKTHAVWETLALLARHYPARLIIMLFAVAAFDFAMAPSVILMAKYLQQTHHYAPGQVTLLYVLGGSISTVGSLLMGRLSDHIGRKVVIIFCGTLCAGSFAVFFSGIGSWILPVSWIVAIFGYLAATALAAGFVAEIFPTAYRATTSTLRYVITTLGGATALALEGPLYNVFHAHGPAITCFLAVMPLALIAILFLPETAGKPLEEIAQA
ncbi:MAG: MFS transporter [Rhizomicrobium sp.]|jgi:putative MFS transporter